MSRDDGFQSTRVLVSRYTVRHTAVVISFKCPVVCSGETGTLTYGQHLVKGSTSSEKRETIMSQARVYFLRTKDFKRNVIT